jgi:hypothetical protein
MIRKNIQALFSDHLGKCLTTHESIYVADYTKQTKSAQATELFKGSPPSDIRYFTVNNSYNLEMDGIPFDNNSFTKPNESIASQCECVIYPHSSNNESWILFLDLKYSNKCKNNKKNLNKARKQLFKTQYYYKSKGVFNKNNICYLLASLPKQSPPFANLSLSPKYLLAMKSKHNVIIRFLNSVEVIDDKHIKV